MNWKEPWEYLFIPYKENVQEIKNPLKRKREEKEEEIVKLDNRNKKRKKNFTVRRLKRKIEEITPDDSSYNV